MKKTLLCLSIIILSTFTVFTVAQNPAGLTEDFNDGNSDNWTAENPGDSIIEENGEMKIWIGSSSEMHQFNFDFDTLNLSENLYISAKIKADNDGHFSFAVKDFTDSISYPITAHFVDSSDFDQYTTYYFDLNKAAFSLFFGMQPVITRLDSTQITGLQVTISPNSLKKDSGYFFIEDLQIGDQALLPTTNETSHLQTFESIVADDIMIHSIDNDSLLIENNQLKFYAIDDSNSHSFSYTFDAIDATDNERVAFKMNANHTCNMSVCIINEYGYSACRDDYYISAGEDEWMVIDFNEIWSFNYPGYEFSFESNLNTVYIGVNYKTTDDNLIVQIDSLMTGDIVGVPTAVQTGYTEDFNDNILDNGWVSEQSIDSANKAHILTEENQELKIEVDKVGYDGLWYDLDLTDLSENPYISVKAKTDAAVPLRIFTWDYQGNYNTGPGDDEVTLNIEPSSEYHTYYFDYLGLFAQSGYQGGGTTDSSKIDALLINFRPGEIYKGTIWLDDLKIGDQAERFFNQPPIIDTVLVPDTIYVSQDSVQVTIDGIGSGDSISTVIMVHVISSDRNTIPNPAFDYNAGDTSCSFYIAPLKAGEITLNIAISDNGSNYTNTGDDDSYQKMVKIVVIDDINTIYDTDFSKTVNVYPNPAKDILNIDVTNNKISTIQICDLTGKNVLRKKSLTKGANEINVSTLETGVYILRIKSIDGIYTEKIMIGK
jgi:hypothetical protein